MDKSFIEGTIGHSDGTIVLSDLRGKDFSFREILPHMRFSLFNAA
jgi:hypothetical protein